MQMAHRCCHLADLRPCHAGYPYVAGARLILGYFIWLVWLQVNHAQAWHISLLTSRHACALAVRSWSCITVATTLLTIIVNNGGGVRELLYVPPRWLNICQVVAEVMAVCPVFSTMVTLMEPRLVKRCSMMAPCHRGHACVNTCA